MADPSTYRPAPGAIPDAPGVYRFRDARKRVIYVGKAKSLRSRRLVVLPGHRQPASAHRHDGHDSGLGRVDRRPDRGRGAAAGVLLDQGVRPALQRQVPRRQVLPMARGDAQRGVPARDGRPRREEEGRALLRALLPRLGDPRDRRPAAAGLPDAIVLGGRLQAQRPDRPAVPARLHRQVLGTLRRAGDCRGASRDRRRLLHLHQRPDEPAHQAARTRDDGGLRRAGVRAGRPAPRRHRRAQAGDGAERDRAGRRHRRRRDRGRRGPARDRRPGVLRPRWPRPRSARLGRRSGRRRRAAGAAAALHHPGLRPRGVRRHTPRGARPAAAR